MSSKASSSQAQSIGKTPDQIPVSAEAITIAITLYNRREYIIQAIESALSQLRPVKVLVVEDCGPDPSIRKFIEEHFPDRIHYHRNATRRGLFGNWNVCLELCTTPWISILHDDDYLTPGFTEAMIDLAKEVPQCGIYFSSIIHVDHSNQPLSPPAHDLIGSSRRIDPRSLAQVNDLLFPGQLFRSDLAQLVGGFREGSQFCGDWEMWFKLAYFFGAAQTSRAIAYCRSHEGIERGTNKVIRNGRKHALDFVQAKRNIALLRKTQQGVFFDRAEAMSISPLPIRNFLPHAGTMSARLLRYNCSLLLLSRPPHWKYAVLQVAARLLGPRFMGVLSRLLNVSGGKR